MSMFFFFFKKLPHLFEHAITHSITAKSSQFNRKFGKNSTYEFLEVKVSGYVNVTKFLHHSQAN